MKGGEKSPVVRLDGARVLIVAAPYYRDVVETLVAGAQRAITQAGAAAEVAEMPGAFELPAAIAAAEAAAAHRRRAPIEAYVALGCVVRGETSHYDYVCGQTARAIMDLTVARGLAVGFGLLTVETIEQARVRAALDGGDKGGEAARAALALAAWKRQLAGASQ